MPIESLALNAVSWPVLQEAPGRGQEVPEGVRHGESRHVVHSLPLEDPEQVPRPGSAITRGPGAAWRGVAAGSCQPQPGCQLQRGLKQTQWSPERPLPSPQYP